MIGETRFETWLGGSSFNVIQALRSAVPELRMGYVGSSGVDDQGVDRFSSWFDENRVDSRFVRSSTSRSGQCLSFINEGERSLLTTRGANDELADLLKDNCDDVAKYLSQARCVHLTSFFDNDTPKLILETILAAKKINTGLIISFDPGHHWSREHSTNPAVLGLLKIADLLFLNTKEFQLLAGALMPGANEVAMADRIIRKCNDNTTVIFQKNYDKISMFFRVFRRGTARRDFSNEALPVEEIEDATGAGDVFAAGIILGILVSGFQMEDSVNLALRMVRRKLVGGGTRNFSRFFGLVEESIDRIVRTTDRKSIFIGHGNDALWMTIQSHLKEKHGLPVRAWESESRINQYPIHVLADMLDEAGFAILILTGEDQSEAGRLRARQNVLHEMGLFQGRLGFSRVIVVRDAQIEVPSNIEGWQSIVIDRNDIGKTLARLDDGLRSAKII